jgi:hypothetical protein
MEEARGPLMDAHKQRECRYLQTFVKSHMKHEAERPRWREEEADKDESEEVMAFQ